MRTEVKFSGTYTQLRKIISQQAAQRAFPTRKINSIYFDTPVHDDFVDSEEGTVPRQKTRLRWYGSSTIPLVFAGALETKSTLPNHREKTAVRVEQSNAEELLDLVNSIRHKRMQPVVMVSYVREYFINPTGHRFTLDRAIQYVGVNRLFRATHTEKDRANILELKVPVDVDDSSVTSEFADLRTRFSKYCEAIKALAVAHPKAAMG